MLHSLSAQVSYYNELIQSNLEWLFCSIFADEALTGTKDSRENFQKLLAECRAGKIDLVITKSISRFARNTVTLLETVRELKSLGVDVYFEEQNIHSISPDGELMLTVLAAYAQEESLSASENQKWRIKRNFEQGKIGNIKMLGYRRNKDGVLEIVPKEAETIRMIFQDYLSGMGKLSICNKLNEMHIPTRYGSEWTPEAVRRILQNEKYCGDLLLQAFNLISANKEDFLSSCCQIRDMLSDCTEIDDKIAALQTRTEELTSIMQAFIKENASKAQNQEIYNQKYSQYEEQMLETEKSIHSLQAKKAERLSRKELLDGMIHEFEITDSVLKTFDEKLWRLMIENVTVSTDGKLTFLFRNGMKTEL